MIPLSLYIHSPWCIRKCPYCDFNSHQAPDELPEQAYVDAVLRDFDADLPLVQATSIHSVFIGGGTPSLMSGGAVQSLLDGLRARLPWAAGAEVTLEANPGASEANRFKAYAAAGINRLSLGVQSFDDQHLQRLGRVHGRQDALAAFAMAREAGIQRINIDLMHGLSEQTIKGALADLQQAIDLGPEHISWYQLTIEQNTAFYSQPPVLPDETVLWDIQQQGQALLAAAGYQQYEVSAYAKVGEMSRHNLNYWQFGDYVGVGPGAHGKLTQPGGDIVRTRKHRMPDRYLAAIIHRVESTPVVASELVFEFMLNALRLRDGCDWTLFEAHTGMDRASIAPLWADLVKKEWVLPDRVATTPVGYQYLNRVVEAFL